MSLFFSIVIPVYNGLHHDLPICLDSIWNQGIDDSLYEVLCVDDCSQDETRQWLCEQEKAHKNLKLVKNSVNIRQGGGRNHGVKEALGKYIVFIDQDDYFHHGALCEVYEHLSKVDLDVFVSDSAFHFKGCDNNKMQLNLKNYDIMTGEDFMERNAPVFAPWRMCLKREFIISNNLWFEENCRIEDVDWACKVLYYAKRVQYLPILLVHYIQGESGQTDNMYRNIETLRANIEAGNRTLQLADTLFRESRLKNKICEIAEMYYNFSCRYLFGMCKPVKKKTELIQLIGVKSSQYTLVEQAIRHPMCFSVISNLAVVPFRLLRKIKRTILAHKE